MFFNNVFNFTFIVNYKKKLLLTVTEIIKMIDFRIHMKVSSILNNKNNTFLKPWF